MSLCINILKLSVCIIIFANMRGAYI